MVTRTRVRRKPERGAYDIQSASSLLREAVYGHLAFVQDNQPYCIPMVHAVHERTLYLHGSAASRALNHAGSGAALCYTVSLVDGLVLAKSMFNSSLNYRSCVVLGVGRVVGDHDELVLAYEALTDQLVPGRSSDVRRPTEKELRQTSFVALPIEEFSVKSRSGDPVDPDDDLGLAHWAGVVPTSLEFGPPEPRDGESASVPVYLEQYGRISRRTAQ